MLTYHAEKCSTHQHARRCCEALLNQAQHIETIFSKHSDEARIQYRIRLNASVDCARFLLRQGLAFRGDKEYEESSNCGNFLELYQFLASHNKNIKDTTLKNAPENLKLTSHDIQKDIVHALAVETTNITIREMGDALFSILVDKSRDVSIKKKMALVLHYVNPNGQVVERFIGIKHVVSTTVFSLKATIDNLFSGHGLSISRLHGQGYDGASNMQGEFNGLKLLIMKENECAYYIHCFAHQLQMSLVALAKNHVDVQSLFNIVANVVNIVEASLKRRDILRDKQAMEVFKALKSGELSNGRGLNQETNLKRSDDTLWGSHYGSFISIITMFPSLIDVLEIIADGGSTSKQRCEANNLVELMQSFTFVFCLHLMKDVLGITN
ncbi:hypothetical protein Ddye_019331 [Dipteronia dyeriana]|uniref:DUF4371 domain-containing protein n=1 Tax=Dipteronia dyeriana TaxID=168575 RepID=A0AAD9TY10_9ROSI|nr:hypothetical protein Ddye_019331 [Dipteronia dyeriana]